MRPGPILPLVLLLAQDGRAGPTSLRVARPPHPEPEDGVAQDGRAGPTSPRAARPPPQPEPEDGVAQDGRAGPTSPRVARPPPQREPEDAAGPEAPDWARIAQGLDRGPRQQPNPPEWPPSVRVFGPEDSAEEIRNTVMRAFKSNGGHDPPDAGMFSLCHFAFLFRPGSYRVDVPVGYYTQVLGLGRSPHDVRFDSPRGVYCEQGDQTGEGGALNTFWRGAENFQASTNMLWAASQASPLRRLAVMGNLHLAQFVPSLGHMGYTSGGFLANVLVSGTAFSGSQQNFCSRNADIGKGWPDGVFNMVFIGTAGAPASHCGRRGGIPSVNVARTPVVAEKPFITVDDDGRYHLEVPHVKRDSVGTDFHAIHRSVDFGEVYVARSTDSALLINLRLQEGFHVVLSPGTYYLESPVELRRAGQVLLGLGLPTLVAANGSAALRVGNVDGVRIAGVILQAGVGDTDALLSWGDGRYAGNPESPGFLHDVFVRVGGTNDPDLQPVRAKVMMHIRSGHVIGDNVWLWRAQRGITGAILDGDNPCEQGLVVTGPHVTMYGLSVEHTLQDAVQWSGEGGETYSVQSELPYDANETFGDAGYVAYRVSDNVTSHKAYGVGVYHFFHDHAVTVQRGIAAPAHLEESFESPASVSLGGKGMVMHVLNDRGNETEGEMGAQWFCQKKRRGTHANKSRSVRGPKVLRGTTTLDEPGTPAPEVERNQSVRGPEVLRGTMTLGTPAPEVGGNQSVRGPAVLQGTLTFGTPAPEVERKQSVRGPPMLQGMMTYDELGPPAPEVERNQSSERNQSLAPRWDTKAERAKLAATFDASMMPGARPKQEKRAKTKAATLTHTSTTPPEGGAKAKAATPTHTSTPPPYNCDAGYEHWRLGWSATKKHHCCNATGRGCQGNASTTTRNSTAATPPTAGPNATETYWRWANEWEELQTSGATTTTDTTTSTTSRTAASTTSDGRAPINYDCSAGYANWERGWSRDKKQWCCKVKHRACWTSTATTTTRTTTDLYDCAAELENWELSWSRGKKAWCCERTGDGCPTTTSTSTYGCSTEGTDWKESWSHERKIWCCLHKGHGCSEMPVTAETTTSAAVSTTDTSTTLEAAEVTTSTATSITVPPASTSTSTTITDTWTTTEVTIMIASEDSYDCLRGIFNWKKGWTAMKKEWCCKHKGRGCITTSTTTMTFDLFMCQEAADFADGVQGTGKPWLDSFLKGTDPAGEDEGVRAQRREWCCKQHGFCDKLAAGPDHAEEKQGPPARQHMQLLESSISDISVANFRVPMWAVLAFFTQCCAALLLCFCIARRQPADEDARPRVAAAVKQVMHPHSPTKVPVLRPGIDKTSLVSVTSREWTAVPGHSPGSGYSPRGNTPPASSGNDRSVRAMLTFGGGARDSHTPPQHRPDPRQSFARAASAGRALVSASYSQE